MQHDLVVKKVDSVIKEDHAICEKDLNAVAVHVNTEMDIEIEGKEKLAAVNSGNVNMLDVAVDQLHVEDYN